MINFKGLLKRIKEIKVEKVITFAPVEKYDSVKDMEVKCENERLKFKKYNPIGYFLYYEVYLPIYRLWANNIAYWPKNTKYFFQRGIRGYDDSYWWQYNYHIAKISIPILLRLRDGSHIVHTECLPETHTYNTQTTEEWYNLTKEDEDYCEKEWKSFLNHIITAFEYVLNLENGTWEYYWDVPENNIEWYTERCKKFNLRPMTKEEQDYMNKGLALWAKYFMRFND